MREDLLIAKFNVIESKSRLEDVLIGQRTTWLGISQSFLFGRFVAVIGQIGGVSAAASMAKLIRLLGSLDPKRVLEAGKKGGFPQEQRVSLRP